MKTIVTETLDFGIEVEILPISAYAYRKLAHNWSFKYPSLIGNQDRWIQQWCQNFDRKVINTDLLNRLHMIPISVPKQLCRCVVSFSMI